MSKVVVSNRAEGKEATGDTILLIPSWQWPMANYTATGKYSRAVDQMFNPALTCLAFAVWHWLSKRVTIMDLLLLKVSRNRHPVLWKVDDALILLTSP